MCKWILVNNDLTITLPVNAIILKYLTSNQNYINIHTKPFLMFKLIVGTIYKLLYFSV